MSKLILMSVVLALIALPLRAASDPNPVRGIRRAVYAVLVFNLTYAFAIRFVLPRLGL